MSPDTLRTVLQIFGVVVGGGILEFARRLLNRRSELRSLDTASDAAALTSATAYILTLQADSKVLRDEITAIKSELSTYQKTLNLERVTSTEALENASREIGRFTSELARVKADLAVAQAQIAELSTRLTGGSTGRGRHDFGGI